MNNQSLSYRFLGRHSCQSDGPVLHGRYRSGWKFSFQFTIFVYHSRHLFLQVYHHATDSFFNCYLFHQKSNLKYNPQKDADGLFYF